MVCSLKYNLMCRNHRHAYRSTSYVEFVTPVRALCACGVKCVRCEPICRAPPHLPIVTATDTKRSEDQTDSAAPRLKKFYKQVDLFEMFLVQYGAEYPLVASLIRVMLIIAANSSLIERAFSTLKAVKTTTRNSLSLQQLELERLLIVGIPGSNLPENLSEFDLEKMIQIMSQD